MLSDKRHVPRKIRYSRGVMYVAPGPYAERIQRYITRLEFLSLPEESRIPTHNRRNRVYRFHLAAIERDVFLKADHVNPRYPLFRRMETRVSNLFKNAGLRGFIGARLLAEAGIGTAAPLAAWTYWQSPFCKCTYFLAERLPTSFSVRDCVLPGAAGPDPEDRAALPLLVNLTADTLAALHARCLRHDDVAAGNLLVRRLPAASAPPGGRYEIYLIDTASVTRARARPASLKTVLDLRSLRRLRLPADLRERFLRRYLGPRYGRFWIAVFEFWQQGGKRPLTALARRLLGVRP